MNRTTLLRSIQEHYAILPDYPWADEPTYAVLRHPHNRKWFALIMTIAPERLGLRGTSPVDIINLKLDPMLILSLLDQKTFFPAYHMSKKNWISVLLGKGVDSAYLNELIAQSYDNTAR